ncbi:MAG: hypothetical protein H5T59_04070 [Anaerolineae bacterium]|nr:hypothetical protein [Anaerolineae bacterium]
MPNTTWKAVERALARRLGGVRTGCTGEAAPDVTTGWCSVECKTRKRLPAWLKEAVAQAVRNAAPDTLPLVVLHQTGQRHDSDLVVLRLRDFEAWYGSVSGGSGALCTETRENRELRARNGENRDKKAKKRGRDAAKSAEIGTLKLVQNLTET